MKDIQTYFAAPISEQIWNAKYKLVSSNPEIHDDLTVHDTWARIADTCASSPIALTNGQAPLDQIGHFDKWYSKFLHTLTDFRFLPAGRIVAGAGAGRNVTLFNCFVMGKIPDSLDGIFDML